MTFLLISLIVLSFIEAGLHHSIKDCERPEFYIDRKWPIWNAVFLTVISVIMGWLLFQIQQTWYSYAIPGLMWAVCRLFLFRVTLNILSDKSIDYTPSWGVEGWMVKFMGRATFFVVKMLLFCAIVTLIILTSFDLWV